MTCQDKKVFRDVFDRPRPYKIALNSQYAYKKMRVINVLLAIALGISTVSAAPNWLGGLVNSAVQGSVLGISSAGTSVLVSDKLSKRAQERAKRQGQTNGTALADVVLNPNIICPSGLICNIGGSKFFIDHTGNTATVKAAG